VPKAKGGTTETRNLVPACLGCNAHKQHHDWLPWFESQDFYSAIRAQVIHEWINAPDE
jgi:hypothetical protein